MRVRFLADNVVVEVDDNDGLAAIRFGKAERVGPEVPLTTPRPFVGACLICGGLLVREEPTTFCNLHRHWAR